MMTKIAIKRKFGKQLYTSLRNQINNKKKHVKELFYNNLDIIVSDFQNNDKRKFWKVIRHFVKNNKVRKEAKIRKRYNQALHLT